MQESYRLSRLMTCEKHNKPLISICVAPQCFNFREMCQLCITNDKHHAKMHYNREQAFIRVQEMIDNLFKGLKALRKKIIQTMDTKINSQLGLNQIEEKLQQIKKILNNKIDNFHIQLRKIYEKNVKQKLNQLFFIVEKSHQFLEEQKIKLFKTQKLRPFFVNDLKNDLKYYESYYQQILEKNVRRFKLGFEHDKVLKLMVNFEQNLEEIFKFDSNSEITLKKQHIMFSNGRNHYIYRMRGNALNRFQIDFVEKNENWIGVMPSVYYSVKDCYYLIGDGQRQSNKIRRMNIENREIKDLEVKLETKRMNFAVCVFNNEIFVVGGENSKEGCLAKCEKFVPSEGKVYIVNSLNQKSAQHSLCVYNNKFILKFGGTDIMGSILQAHAERYYPLNPQIYSAETEDWKLITFQGSGQGYMGTRLNFGLWPGIFIPSQKNKIIILSGEQASSRKAFKTRFDIQMDQGTRQLNQLKQLRISASKLSMNSKTIIFSQCCLLSQDENIYFLAMDENKNGLFFTASIFNMASQNRIQSTKV